MRTVLLAHLTLGGHRCASWSWAAMVGAHTGLDKGGGWRWRSTRVKSSLMCTPTVDKSMRWCASGCPPRLQATRTAHTAPHAGGVWLDMDTQCFAPMEPILKGGLQTKCMRRVVHVQVRGLGSRAGS